VTLLPLYVSTEECAAALADVAAQKKATPWLPKSFTRNAMGRRAAWIYPRVLARAARRVEPDGLWLVANNFSTGGAQSSARRLLLALHSAGVRVRAAVLQEHPDFPTPGRGMLNEAGIPVLALVPPGNRAVEDAALPLIEAIERDPPQAVIFWNAIASWKVVLADALLEPRIFDVSPGEMFFTSLERFFERVPSGFPYRAAGDYGARLDGAVVKYGAEAQRAADVLGCSVTVIPNGVPLRQDVAVTPMEKKGGSPFVIGTAARLSPDKRLGDLIEAIRLAAPKMPRFVLRIAGGVERDFPGHADELRRRARGLPVEFLGELADTGAFLAGLDLFVMISEPAGCPNASLEAMAAGLPVLATDFGGAGEQVVDGVTGRLVPPRDAGAFAAALVSLAHDAPLRAQMGDAGRERARSEFSMERMVGSYRKLFGV
jgi:glycosyltransferase involved in cell wall biosynthesis